MSQTWEIQKVAHTTVATNVPSFDRTNMVMVDEYRSDDGLHRRGNYVLAEGDTEYPFEIRIEIRYNPQANNGFGTTSLSMRLSTRCVLTDDTTSEVLSNEPISVVTAVTVPGVGGLIDNDQVLDLLGNAYSLWYNGVTTAEPNNTVLASLAYGIAQLS